MRTEVARSTDGNLPSARWTPADEEARAGRGQAGDRLAPDHRTDQGGAIAKRATASPTPGNSATPSAASLDAIRGIELSTVHISTLER